MSWAPFGGQTVRDTEIGINALVAQAIGNITINKFDDDCDSSQFLMVDFMRSFDFVAGAVARLDCRLKDCPKEVL